MKPRKRHYSQSSCSRSLCNMQSSSRLSTSTADLNMDTIGDDHLKNKRKGSAQGSDIEDDTNEDSISVRNDDNKKHNHSEIEKRRRDKMNTYITELASMIPMCHTMSRKLDKLTVLRMAVQHMKTMRGTVSSYTEGHYKPPFLTDQDLKNLITQAAEGFVFAVSCDRGKILYISKSVTQVLNYLPEDLVENNIFDYIHPKDVAKVKEQLSCSDFSPRERYIDAKTMLPVRAKIINTMSKMCSGARRSFFCRMKCKVYSVKEEADTTTGSKYTQSDSSSVESKSSFKSSNVHGSKSRDRRYSVIQCTGYLKPWSQISGCENVSLKNLEQADDNDGTDVGVDSESAKNISCLVAVGRIINNSASTSLLSDIVKPPCFTSKHTIDGKFLSVDQRVTYIVGFLPQELLGTSMYEYFHQDDISRLVDVHKATLQDCKPKDTETYKFRAKDKTYVHLRSEWKSFRNPWTKDIEFIVANNNLTKLDSKPDSSNKSECSSQGQAHNYDVFTEQQLSRSQQQMGSREIQNLIISHLEASKIGRQIADTALDTKKKNCDTDDSSPSNGQHSIIKEVPNNHHHHNNSLNHNHNNNNNTAIKKNKKNDTNSISCNNNNNNNTTTTNNNNNNNNNTSSSSRNSNNSSSNNSNDNIPFLRSPLVVLNDPGASSSNVGGGSCGAVSYSVIRDNVNQSSSTSTACTDLDNTPPLVYQHSGLQSDPDDVLGDIMTPSPQQLSSSDTNDEAAMAVIMSLLEADAGLGGPVDFSGLPWPLP